MSKQRIAIIEIGGSHDECILSQVLGLKEQGCEVYFFGNEEIYLRNTYFKSLFDGFYKVELSGKTRADVNAMVRLKKQLKQKGISKVICNTAQGGHIRNLMLISLFSPIKFYGILHTIKKIPNSFTQKIISLKIKNYFVLNDTLLAKIPEQKHLTINSFYPLDYPNFDERIEKTRKWRVTIIGGVENRRKDLDGFINIAKQANKDISFVFLGKSDVKNTEVVDFIEKLKENQLFDQVKLFDSFISEELFDAYLQNTDLILPLVHPHTPSADEYFNRQISGAINVAFSYSIPMLIHQQYAYWEDFSKGCLFYDLANVSETLTKFFTHHQAYKKALQSHPKFSADLQRKRFSSLIINS
ncbi:hypothetical protein CW751_01480 [Brumimicrobium salinarum]|uniref:Glycosyl transferase family 1 domain-containing protein n=1 Tax=Brumimicrobium salinarum TaxID=2058658 RepID=A0A2I0R643_9FLAO|nr:hypothetical protein [Brumimicrobium salinarum]PKR82035.1 hypothetical protein CW751_01480 [Brumimicrobium salinarum]